MKLPTYPQMLVTSVRLISFMRGWRPASAILGARIQIEQSMVGKVLSIWAILPPMDGSFSTKTTSYPESARSRAAWMPATPPPMTRAFWITGMSASTWGSSSRALATDMRTRSLAFSVASCLSWRCTHEQCSRMLAISSR